jgi:hypothetical protein
MYIFLDYIELGQLDLICTPTKLDESQVGTACCADLNSA